MLSFTRRVDLVSNEQCAEITEDCDHAGTLSEKEEEEEEEEEEEQHSSSGE